MIFSLIFPAFASDPLWPELSEPPSVGGGRNDAAVVIAIEDYNSVSDIPGAKANGLDWYSYLTEGRGISPGRVQLLTNNDATREGIQDAVEQARDAVRSEGTLWFVFIGHGAPSADGQDGLLVGWDTQQTASSVYARGLLQSEVMSALEEGDQAQTVAIIDACFSGRSGSDDALVSGLQPMIPSYALAAVRDTVVLSAGGSNQFAGPLPGADRPAFSYLALGALWGWGDANEDGIVTTGEVQEYALGALSALPIGRSQTPAIAGSDSLTLSQARAEGPSLSAIRRALEQAPPPAQTLRPAQPERSQISVNGGSEDYSTLVANAAAAAAQQRSLNAERRQRVDAAAEQIRTQAAADYSQLKTMLASYSEETYHLLNAFIAQYGSASVVVDRTTIPIQIAEVGESMALLGYRYDYGLGTAHNLDRSTELYGLACNAGSGMGCAFLGRQFQLGRGRDVDMSRAVELYEQARDLNDARGYEYLAFMYVKGYGVAQNATTASTLRADARERYEEQCASGYLPDCTALGTMYLRGLGGSRDRATALEVFIQSCDLGDPEACYQAALVHLQGLGVPESPATAIPLLTSACEDGLPASCARLGYLYANGKGVPEDERQAVALFTQACDQGHSLGCYNLGVKYASGEGIRQDIQQAIAQYILACDLGYGPGCYNLALNYASGNNIQQDLQQAHQRWTRGCQLGHQESCTKLQQRGWDSNGFPTGARVECNWQNRGTYYPGQVQGRAGRNLTVLYDDGYTEQTTIYQCRPK